MTVLRQFYRQSVVRECPVRYNGATNRTAGSQGGQNDVRTEQDRFWEFSGTAAQEKGMTQKELAACLYVSDKAVSKWERGLSVPDISLLVPLAEQLNVTVAELLQGCRVEEEQRFTREETEELIRKALTFSAEPPERRQARTQKFLPLYGVSVVLGLVETAAVWAVGLAGTEGAIAIPAKKYQ